jgi:hypothetical protein
MSSGFNTDIDAGDRLFHVQTEDRGPEAFVIDTAVYHNGRVLYRRSCNYEHFAKSAEFNAEDLHDRVEEQHRSVIEDLQSGVLDAEIMAALEKAAQAAGGASGAAGIQVQLLNPKSWLSGGEVSLELEVVRRGDQGPEEGAQVEAAIEGVGKDIVCRGKSDKRGRVRLQFPLPAVGRDDVSLVIQARNQSSREELRFALRAKPKAPPTGAIR